MLSKFVADIGRRLRDGHVLYLHCHDGNDRSGVVAALVLGALYGVASGEALDRVQRARDTRAGPPGRSPDHHESTMLVHRLLGSKSWVDATRSAALGGGGSVATATATSPSSAASAAGSAAASSAAADLPADVQSTLKRLRAQLKRRGAA